MRLLTCVALLAGLLTGCEGSGRSVERFSPEPLPPPSATLHVSGLSCPLCATNIESPLKRLPGVGAVRVDLEQGLVRLALAGDSRPSQRQIATAVADAGFTLTKIETP